MRSGTSWTSWPRSPMRQYQDFIFFERAEPPRFMQEARFDFARVEDKDSTSEAKMTRLARGLSGEGPQGRGRRSCSGGDRGLFRDDVRPDSPGRERPDGRGAAPPRGAREVRRARLSPAVVARRTGRTARVLSRVAQQGGLAHEDAIRDAVASVLLSPRFCFHIDSVSAGRGGPAAVRLRPGQPAELLPLVEHARRGAAGPRRRRRSAPAGSPGRPGAADASRRAGPRPGHRVRRQLAGVPPLRGAQRRRSRAASPASPTSSARRCTRSRSASSSTWRSGMARCSSSSTPITRSSTRSWRSTTASRSAAHGPDDWVRVDGVRRYGRGGLLPMSVFLTDQLAGPADQPRQAGLLGRPQDAGRDDPPAAAGRPRAAQGRGEAGRADPAAAPGPAPRGQGVRRVPPTVRLDRPGVRGLRADRRASRPRPRRPPGRRPGHVPRRQRRGRPRRPAPVSLRAAPGRVRRATSAASCSPTPWAAA